MRQGLLSEPKASSGPAAMLLAVSRSPSTYPPTESLPGPIPPSSGVPLSIPTKKNGNPADPTLPDTGTKTPVKQTYTMYNQHSLSAQLNYHQKVLSATQDRWPAL